MEKYLFIDSSQKSAILDCSHFERFSKTVFHKILVLLSTTNVEELLEISHFLNF
jgi:hypothetical protein